MDILYIFNIIFLSGDFNIDLFKRDSRSGTKQFIDVMYSLGLYPLIIRQSRISATSATLIDNIFTSELDYNIDNGLLINDISDHLPICAVCKRSIVNNVSNSANI